MIFFANWFEPLFSWLALAVVLFWVIHTLPVFVKTVQSHAVNTLLAMLSLVGFHFVGLTLEGGELAGLSFHLLGLSLAALICNRQSALCMGVLVVAAFVAAKQPEQLAALPLTVLFTLLPAYGVFVLLEKFSHRFLPEQLFVYIFVRGFLGSAFTMLCTGVLMVLVLSQSNVFSGSFVSSVLPAFFLLTWSEAFLSGIAVALMVAFKPSFLLSFDDERYLKPVRQIWK